MTQLVRMLNRPRFRFHGPLTGHEAAELTQGLVGLGMSVTSEYKGRGVWHIFGIYEAPSGNPRTDTTNDRTGNDC
jgi:hypothetical protein